MTLSDAQTLVNRARRDELTVVFTNGVFDLLHVGHLRYLRQAHTLGDLLIVGLNSDASTRSIKGDHRPVVPQAERAELLEALQPVDAVVLFEERTAEHLVDALRPDIYVKGGDYQPADLPEAAVVERYGGQVRILQFVEGHSSTDLIATIRERFCP